MKPNVKRQLWIALESLNKHISKVYEMHLNLELFEIRFRSLNMSVYDPNHPNEMEIKKFHVKGNVTEIFPSK